MRRARLLQRRAHQFSAASDFVTAPELGSLFAASMADALAPALRAAGDEACFVGHRRRGGAFAETALRAWSAGGAAEALPHPEPSADLRERQRVPRRRVAGRGVRPRRLARPPARTGCAACCSPTRSSTPCRRRFVLRDGEVFENTSTSARGPSSSSTGRPTRSSPARCAISRRPGAAFADGYRSNCCRSCRTGYRRCSVRWRPVLPCSSILAIRAATALPQRSDGTLACHYRHRAHADALL